MSIVIGMDIGGTSVKLGVWRGAARLAWRENLAVPRITDESGIADVLARYVTEIATEVGERPSLLGIGSCGLIADGIILQSPNTTWDRLELTALLEGRLELTVYLLNDADAFLLASMDVIDDRECVALGITLGTGIGTAVWVRDRLLRGGSGISPEGGHITLAMDEPPANTGIPGSWESLACRDWLLSEYAKAGATAQDPREIARLARTGDAQAMQVWKKYGHNVGAGLACLGNIFSPQHVLIGGGLAAAHDLFEGEMQTALKRHMLAGLPSPRVQFVEEAADLVAKGGARYAALRAGAPAV